MKNRYDGAPGKDAAISNTRHKRFEAEHREKNAFVKREQAALSKYEGHNPVMSNELMEFNANMQNTGQWAQGFCDKLTEGLDKVAFPINEDPGHGNGRKM
jgi:hypothetical protein